MSEIVGKFVLWGVIFMFLCFIVVFDSLLLLLVNRLVYFMCIFCVNLGMGVGELRILICLLFRWDRKFNIYEIIGGFYKIRIKLCKVGIRVVGV